MFLKISWKPFQERFTRQLRRFREQGDLIDKEANLCHMLEEADSQALEEFNRMQVEKEKQGTLRRSRRSCKLTLYREGAFAHSRDAFLN